MIDPKAPLSREEAIFFLLRVMQDSLTRGDYEKADGISAKITRLRTFDVEARFSACSIGLGTPEEIVPISD